MAGGCRDCSRCTEPGFMKMFRGLISLLSLGLIPLMSNIKRSGQRKCPVCGHPMSWHAKVGGRFMD